MSALETEDRTNCSASLPSLSSRQDSLEVIDIESSMEEEETLHQDSAKQAVTTVSTSSEIFLSNTLSEIKSKINKEVDEIPGPSSKSQCNELGEISLCALKNNIMSKMSASSNVLHTAMETSPSSKNVEIVIDDDVVECIENDFSSKCSAMKELVAEKGRDCLNTLSSADKLTLNILKNFKSKVSNALQETVNDQGCTGCRKNKVPNVPKKDYEVLEINDECEDGEVQVVTNNSSIHLTDSNKAQENVEEDADCIMLLNDVNLSKPDRYVQHERFSKNSKTVKQKRKKRIPKSKRCNSTEVTSEDEVSFISVKNAKMETTSNASHVKGEPEFFAVKLVDNSSYQASMFTFETRNCSQDATPPEEQVAFIVLKDELMEKISSLDDSVIILEPNDSSPSGMQLPERVDALKKELIETISNLENSDDVIIENSTTSASAEQVSIIALKNELMEKIANLENADDSVMLDKASQAKSGTITAESHKEDVINLSEKKDYVDLEAVSPDEIQIVCSMGQSSGSKCQSNATPDSCRTEEILPSNESDGMEDEYKCRESDGPNEVLRASEPSCSSVLRFTNLSLVKLKSNMREKLSSGRVEDKKKNEDGSFESNYCNESDEHSELVVADQLSNCSGSDDSDSERVKISFKTLKNAIREKIKTGAEDSDLPTKRSRSCSRRALKRACILSSNRNPEIASNLTSKSHKESIPLNQKIVEKVQGRLLRVTLPFMSYAAETQQPSFRLKGSGNKILPEVQARRHTSEENGQSSRKVMQKLDDLTNSDNEDNLIPYKEIMAHKCENYTHIMIVPNEKKQNVLTFQALCQLKTEIVAAKEDPSCKLLLLSSSGRYFCSGLDMTLLVGLNKEQAVVLLAHAVRGFIKSLATFPKPVVAAVNGITVGLGVIMLTYCDVVFSSEDATYWAPYCQLGYIPEGAGTDTLSQVVGRALASEMLLRGKKLTANEALTCGLVSEILWADAFLDEVAVRVQAMAKQSSQGMEVTKRSVRSKHWKRVEAALDREVTILSKQWMAPACQKAMKIAVNGIYYITDGSSANESQ